MSLPLPTIPGAMVITDAWTGYGNYWTDQECAVPVSWRKDWNEQGSRFAQVSRVVAN